MPKQSKGNNHMSELNVFPALQLVKIIEISVEGVLLLGKLLSILSVIREKRIYIEISYAVIWRYQRV